MVVFSLLAGFVLATGTAVISAVATRDVTRTLHQTAAELEQHELAGLATDSAAAEKRAELSQTIVAVMAIAACVLSGAGALLLIRWKKELDTLVTVCAWTRRVKLNDSWVTFEEYLQARFNLQFTHGISEEAAEKLRQEMIELAEADSLRFGSRSDSAAPFEDLAVHQPQAKAA